MKKRLISLVLALTLVAAMALPASAVCVTMVRSWNGVDYATNDACYTNRFGCAIESDSVEHTLRTGVNVWKINGTLTNFYGQTSALVSTTAADVPIAIKYIDCTHYINDNPASYQRVYPG